MVMQVRAEEEEETPAWVKEKVAKAETESGGEESQPVDADLKPTVLADILVYDTSSKGCAGKPGNIGPCITSEEGMFKTELYMCDTSGQLLIARCVDKECQKCAGVRKDDYGYGNAKGHYD